jgi:magnesium chelatase family protein
MSSAVYGIEAHLVEAEVDISSGLPSFNIVGLPDAACRESADRVRAAIRNSGLSFPSRKITVNLAPADIRKEGSSFDLAIALGILVAGGALEQAAVEKKIFCGELSLDGEIRSVTGILPRAAGLLSQGGGMDFVVPFSNAREAAACGTGLQVYAAKHLSQTVRFLKGDEKIEASSFAVSAFSAKRRRKPSALDFADIKGQAHVKRGLEIAAAGGHNVLMIGPPGAGKTMLAKRLPTILSSITQEEAIETTKIHSVAGFLSDQAALVDCRPFRDPHHTISNVAMIGGGTYPRPGEVSLAHHGVLFLDELAEFRRNVLEVLRQPLEDGKVTISRASSSLTFPARFMLVAAMNPCPCGYFTDPRKECHCTAVQIKNYMSKVSGPLLDRIDIQLEVPCLKVEEITEKIKAESSAKIRGRVEKARDLQRARFRAENMACNAELDPEAIERYCPVAEEGENLLKAAIRELGFSARAYHKSLKLARTIADLESSDAIQASHVAEAIHFRVLDRSQWFR